MGSEHVGPPQPGSQVQVQRLRSNTPWRLQRLRTSVLPGKQEEGLSLSQGEDEPTKCCSEPAPPAGPASLRKAILAPSCSWSLYVVSQSLSMSWGGAVAPLSTLCLGLHSSLPRVRQGRLFLIHTQVLYSLVKPTHLFPLPVFLCFLVVTCLPVPAWAAAGQHPPVHCSLSPFTSSSRISSRTLRACSSEAGMGGSVPGGQPQPAEGGRLMR